MLPLLKKPTDKPTAATVPAWHPNFRNFERLPDTKVVRTSFFINGIAVVVVLILGITLFYREYSLNTLRQQTAYWESEVTKNKQASDRAIVLFKQFQEEEKQIFALRDFMQGSKIVVSDFVLQLGESIPATIMLTGLEYRPTVILLRANVAGTADTASGETSLYLDKLRVTQPFKDLFENVKLNAIVRDPAAGLMRIEVGLQFKTPKAPAAPAKK